MTEEKKLTGYPSIDKPWRKYYQEDAIEADIPAMSIYRWIRSANVGNEKSIAIKYLGYSMRYKNLFNEIDRCASAFRRLGVTQGEIVTLAIPNIPENVICIYALNKIGAIANLIDLRCQGADLVRYYSEVNSRIVVVCDIFLQNTIDILEKTSIETLIVTSPYDHLPWPIQTVLKYKYRYRKENRRRYIYAWKNFIGQGDNQNYEADVNEDDVACIMHTSGTTGESKGVMLSNRAFNAMTVEYKYGYRMFNAGDIFFNQVPPFLAYCAIVAIHIPLSLQLTIDMEPEYRPDKFAKNMIKKKANHVAAGPADWSNFLDNRFVGKKDLSFIKTLGSGSDTMIIEKKRQVNDLMKAHGCNRKVMEGYGMTEVGSAACTNLPQIDVEGSVGIPLPKMTFCIYDNEHDQELPYNQSGEICISGPTVMNSYYNRPEETSAVLRDHGDSIIWMHTGDMGHIDENGCVFLEGRLKRIIIQYNGMKINPYEVEKVLLMDADVSECCVVGSLDKEHGSGAVPAAFIVAKAAAEKKEIEVRLRSLCDAELVERYRPVQYHFIDQLPLTPNGKVDYRTLEEYSMESK